MKQYAPQTAALLRRAAKKAREATVERDRLIRQLREDGATLRAIAEACDLSHTAVAKVLAKNAP